MPLLRVIERGRAYCHAGAARSKRRAAIKEWMKLPLSCLASEDGIKRRCVGWAWRCLAARSSQGGWAIAVSGIDKGLVFHRPGIWRVRSTRQRPQIQPRQVPSLRVLPDDVGNIGTKRWAPSAQGRNQSAVMNAWKGKLGPCAAVLKLGSRQQVRIPAAAVLNRRMTNTPSLVEPL